MRNFGFRKRLALSVVLLPSLASQEAEKGIRRIEDNRRRTLTQ
jgi:hypothetical protein